MEISIFLTVRDREWVADRDVRFSFVISVIGNRGELPQAGLDVNVNSHAVRHLPELRGHRDHQ